MIKVKGIKRGQIIELLEQINIPDGKEITIEINIEQPLTEQERVTKLNQLFGVWKEQPVLDEIFAEIDKERHTYQGRTMESLDN